MIRSNLSTLEADGALAVLTLDNGPKNLLTEPEFIQQSVLLDFLRDNPGIKGLVITGKGRHFSHGADVSLFGTSPGSWRLHEHYSAPSNACPF